jgi:hypothetical protein
MQSETSLIGGLPVAAIAEGDTQVPGCVDL